MALPPADMAISIFCILIAIGGLITNACVLVTILSSKDLRTKDYICFILNRTLIDFLYCLILGTLQPWAILTESSDLCKIAAFAEVNLTMSTIFTEPALACNRYASIFYNTHHKKFYKIRNVIWMCVGIWVAGIVTAAPHIFTGSLGRVTGVACCITLSRDSVLVTALANYIPIFLGMGAVAYFNYKIYRFLYEHQNQQMTNSQRTKLQNDREMLRFIIVAACLPLVIQAPVVTAFWVHMFVPLNSWLLFSMLALFLTMYPVNPVITLYMVRPLRNRFIGFMGRVAGKNITMVSAISIIPGSVAF